jgi:hypothetical protein
MSSFGHYVTVGDGAEGSIKRNLARDSLFLGTTLTFANGSPPREVRVRNLSEEGMMIDLVRAVPVGTIVGATLRGNGDVTGRIAWCEQGRAGIKFDAPIDPKLARQPVGGGTTTPGYAKSI